MNIETLQDIEPISKARADRFRWMWALLGLLVIVLAVETAIRTRPEDPLKGDDEDATVGLAAVLSKTPPSGRIALLRKSAQDSNPGLRFAAVEAMGDTKDPALAGDVERAFTDSSSIVRMRALEGLHKVDKERGFRLLLIGLRDEDQWIREAAITQIAAGATNRSRFVDRRAIPLLMPELENTDQLISAASMDVLRRLTGKPWRFRKGMSKDERIKVIGRWKAWWAVESAHSPIAPEFSKLEPIRPSRTDPAPDFRLPDLQGQAISLQGQAGKVTLLNFWGSWCAPCRLEVPGLVKLNSLYGGQGFDLIGVAVAESEPPKFAQWCESNGVTYRQALATPQVLESFGSIEEVPVSVLIDQKGRIRYRWDGERDFATYRSAVERLLREKA